MLKSCKYCGGIHDESFICASKPKPRTFNTKKETAAYFFRNTKPWQLKRDEIRSRDLNCCRVCFHNGKIVTSMLSVHHIESLEESFDKRLDNDNLITTCDRCHKLAESGKIKKEFLRELADTPPTIDELLKLKSYT